jgi:DNA-binding transcriptional LysR family regulator
MQIETLRLFVQVVEAGSFSAAARLHGVTQSAVSQQIQALEERFGVLLIERGGRGVALTQEGEALLGMARDVLGRVGDFENTLARLRVTVSGPLRVCAVPSIGLHELPAVLREFRKFYPGVRVETDFDRSARVCAAVQRGDADIGLVAYPQDRRGLEVRTFWRDRLVCVCRADHAVAKLRRINLSLLHREPFAAFSRDLPTRKFLDRELRKAGVRVRTVLESDHVETVKRMIENEGLLSVLPETAVRNEVRAGSLRTIRFAPADLWRPLGVLVKRGRAESPRLREFLDFLQDFDLGGEAAEA